MKKRLFKTMFLSFMLLLTGFCLTGCGEKSNPEKLIAPVVTLTNDIATWETNSNADKFEISLNGKLSQVENSYTQEKLTDGQSLKVRAIGDGVKYTTSDWSNTVIYTAPINPTPNLTKLGTPMVTISDLGLATWTAITNASSYKYQIGNEQEQTTTQLSVQLENGQSIKVKAVGDGVNYQDGDYSAVVTYTVQDNPTQNPTTAPTYLGIMASNEEPTSDSIPVGITLLSSSTTRVSLEEALKSYLQDTNNSLGEVTPNASNYDLYSSSEQTVYIQIWLNNPDQNTILSLKLNGTKYQSGGTLQSFFIEDNGSYLNCVYAAVSIPSGTYREISYEVTEIEYVEGSNISQNGKAVLIDEDKDTVTIGLPYREILPTTTISNVVSTASSISLNVNVEDQDNFVELIGGWLRVIIYNYDNEILGQQKLLSGDNQVTFNNLSADTYYNIMVFVLGDIQDGNGVTVHQTDYKNQKTENVLTYNIQSQVLLNESTNIYYPVINVEAELNDLSFTFTKIEVCLYGYSDGGYSNEEIVYTSEFNGSVNITEGILNDKTYIVKIYYKNSLQVEQIFQEYIYVEAMYYPYVTKNLEYGLIDDAILGFNFGNDKYNLENLTIKIYDENSKIYMANDALYLINNPTAIEDLEEEWYS
ncbi:MAG: hypothetical protein IJW82_00360, partial [Clostridia bacterium]|nr:hypothetical protein [Clostridia bacterium]